MKQNQLGISGEPSKGIIYPKIRKQSQWQSQLQ